MITSYQNYKIESNLLNLTPNNIFHFLFLFLFTSTYK